MTATAPPVDRKVAHSLNPLIGIIFTEDTLLQVSSVISDMGFMLSSVAKPSEGYEPQFRSLYLFCDVIAAALDYEVSNQRLSGAPAPKEK